MDRVEDEVVMAARLLPDSHDVAVFAFDEVAGSTTFVNTGSGTGNLTSNGVTNFTPGQAGVFTSAVHVQGENGGQGITAAGAFQPTSAITLSMWVKPTVFFYANMGRFFFKPYNYSWSSPYVSTTIEFTDGAGNGHAYIATNTGTILLPFGTGTIPANVFTHVGLAFDGQYLKLYANGVLINTGNVSPGSVIDWGTSQPWVVGRTYNSSQPEAADVYLCDLRIANTARDITYFQQVYALATETASPHGTSEDGYGIGPWGATPWGDGGKLYTTPFAVLSAYAVRENVIRITFNGSVYYSGLYDVQDASYVANYAITTVAGTQGLEGSHVWGVNIVRVDAVETDSTSVDVVLDRPMTPYPAAYMLAVSTAWDASRMRALQSAASLHVYGVHQAVETALSLAKPRARDIASPQTHDAMLDPLPDPTDPRNLGSIPVDDTGDYAFDDGITALKKRVLRRIFSKRGGFAHLPNYGIDIASYGKKLSTTHTRAQLAAETERQLASEPEIAKVAVRFAQIKPGLFRMDILCRTRQGAAVKLAVPLSW